jgi:cysteine desulfurase
LCVGLGEACRIAGEEMAFDHAHVSQLSDKFLNELKSNIPMMHLNGSETRRYPGIMNLSFEFVEGESMIMGIKNIAVSSGSACTSASLEPSYVIRALGHKENISHTSIRFGFS